MHEEDLADGFISMETTIEFKTDLTEIQEKWPYVYDAIKIKKNKFTIPLLLFAAKEKETNFNFFRSVGTAKTFYASYLKPFTHNSYTSFYMSRYFSPKEVENPDSEVLLSQIKGYSEHLNLMFDFLETIRTNTELNMENYDAFQIEQED
ncbi:hypothetical protein [Flagellimonas okinawensis]|uniref:Uncharacterized protein n=1 Tax=Flagellimonas okinawensis TaxID=3031324 RepID=A0ABT5XII0_9FLAO|nr:hypothetical protein [[Muricauda] okinawensis]MDF0705682.1 hypothetical protein [[Muricauda] okinawensis]